MDGFERVIFNFLNYVPSFFLNFMSNHKFKFSFWFIFNFISAFIFKIAISVYYRKKSLIKKDENKEIYIENIHDEYPEFCRPDKELSFIYIFFGFCTFVWLKLILWSSLLIITYLECK